MSGSVQWVAKVFIIMVKPSAIALKIYAGRILVPRQDYDWLYVGYVAPGSLNTGWNPNTQTLDEWKAYRHSTEEKRDRKQYLIDLLGNKVNHDEFPISDLHYKYVGFKPEEETRDEWIQRHIDNL